LASWCEGACRAARASRRWRRRTASLEGADGVRQRATTHDLADPQEVAHGGGQRLVGMVRGAAQPAEPPQVGVCDDGANVVDVAVREEDVVSRNGAHGARAHVHLERVATSSNTDAVAEPQ